MTRQPPLLLIGFLVLFTAGCAQIPEQELSQYRNAFAEVQQASEEILVDFAEAKEVAEKRVAATDADANASDAPTPVLFSTELQSFGAKEPEAVEVRRTALRTIDKFNNVLVTLAEGKSVEAVQGAAGGFVQAAGKFVAAAAGSAVPGLSAVTSVVQTLVGQFEKARLREEFETAVRAGAPVIEQMLIAFIEERTDHITLRAIEANERQLFIVNEITTTAASLRDLVATHSAPAAGADDPLPTLQEDLNAALEPAASGLAFKLPLTLTYGSGGPSFGTDQATIAQQGIAQIREQSARFQANVAQFESLRSALNNYGAMLDKARTALKTLAEALDKPPKFEEVSDELFQIAFSLKRDIEAFKAARKAAQ